MKLTSSLALLACMASSASAALTLTNVSLSSSEISFRILGVVEGSSINANVSGSLFFGFPGIPGVMQEITMGSSGKYGGTYDASGGLSWGTGFGGYFELVGMDPIVEGMTVDYIATFYGTFSVAGVTPSDLVAQIGFSATSPTLVGGPGNTVAASGSVPEPSTAFLGLFGAAILLGRRR